MAFKRFARFRKKFASIKQGFQERAEKRERINELETAARGRIRAAEENKLSGKNYSNRMIASLASRETDEIIREHKRQAKKSGKNWYELV